VCFHGFPEEMAALPQMYGPPGGSLLLAEIDGLLAGCAAVRPLEETICELKRVYVRAAYRGAGVGRLLTLTALQTARDLGYRRVRLDTLPEMQPAQRLYESLGFYDIPAYYSGAIPGKRFMEAVLEPDATSHR
jgi:ribosomal protein S18 acetylase RimI-like enzyme